MRFGDVAQLVNAGCAYRVSPRLVMLNALVASSRAWSCSMSVSRHPALGNAQCACRVIPRLVMLIVRIASSRLGGALIPS